MAQRSNGEGQRPEVDWAPYITQKTKDERLAHSPSRLVAALPRLPTSYLGTGVAGNNTYITYNIWPLSPYADPDLYQWCQGLPAHFRANKNIVRAWYQARHLPEAIYNPPVNEDFGEFFRAAFLTGAYDRIVPAIAANSILDSLGYVDSKAVLELYDQCRRDFSELVRGRYYIYNWLALELHFRSMPQTAAV